MHYNANRLELLAMNKKRPFQLKSLIFNATTFEVNICHVNSVVFLLERFVKYGVL